MTNSCIYSTYLGAESHYPFFDNTYLLLAKSYTCIYIHTAERQRERVKNRTLKKLVISLVNWSRADKQ